MRQPRHASFPATNNAKYFDSISKTIYNCTQIHHVLSRIHNCAIAVGVFFCPKRGSILHCNSPLTASRDVPAGATVCDDSQAQDLGSETDVFWAKCPGLSVISKEDDVNKLIWSACEVLL